MERLKDKIRRCGKIASGNVLKVDSFLNHQMDIRLFEEIGWEFKKRFADVEVNKILTIEASGIGIACMTARYFDVPVVFAKKTRQKTLQEKSIPARLSRLLMDGFMTLWCQKNFWERVIGFF